MNSDTRHSGSASAPTSSVAAAKKDQKDYDAALDPAVPDEDLTEAQYLRRQAERAKLAISHTASAMKQSLLSGSKKSGKSAGESFSVKKERVVRKHPWMVLGIAAVVGFFAAVFLSPNRYRRLRSRLSKLEERFRKSKPADGKSAKPDGEESSTAAAAKASIFSTLGTMALREGWKFVEPLAKKQVDDWMERARAMRTGEPADGAGANGRSPASPTESDARPRAAGDALDPRMTPGGQATSSASTAAPSAAAVA